MMLTTAFHIVAEQVGEAEALSICAEVGSSLRQDRRAAAKGRG